MSKILFEEDIFESFKKQGIESLLSQESRIGTLKLALQAEDAAGVGDATVFIVFDPPAEEGGVECMEVHRGELNDVVRKLNEQYDRIKPPGMPSSSSSV
jgi:hypothetical protein